VGKQKSKKQEAVGFEFRTHSKSIQLATRLNIYGNHSSNTANNNSNMKKTTTTTI